LALGYRNGFDGNDSFGQQRNFSDHGDGFGVTHADVWYSGSGDAYTELVIKEEILAVVRDCQIWQLRQ
jgi:hypothetical protein